MASRIAVRASLFAIVSMVFAAGCMAAEGTGSTTDLGTGRSGPDDPAADRVIRALSVTNLTADQPGVAPNVASSLVNAWGIVPFDRMFWTADNGTGKVSIIDGKGQPVTGKPASGAIDLGAGITGVAVTSVGGDDVAFPIHAAQACKPAVLIFASETGKLFGVNPELSITGGFVVVDRSSVGAIYKGVAVIQGPGGLMVLAADFHNARIDVFDANFQLVTNVSFEVTPALPDGFAPFNVMAFGDTVFVTFAKQDADAEDEVPGPGLGFVAAFDTSGKMLGLAKGPALNAPWGMALACNFGPFPNSLLVGNFGDGHITAIETPSTASTPSTLKVHGQLKDRSGAPIAIDGLWGLSFGIAVDKARPDGLYFTAGPAEEAHGLFGVISPAPAP
jgi:uncharacterized protein (TIGR03118 family)